MLDRIWSTRTTASEFFSFVVLFYLAAKPEIPDPLQFLEICSKTWKRKDRINTLSQKKTGKNHTKAVSKERESYFDRERKQRKRVCEDRLGSGAESAGSELAATAMRRGRRRSRVVVLRWRFPSGSRRAAATWRR
jgi:hypothetical protein